MPWEKKTTNVDHQTEDVEIPVLLDYQKFKHTVGQERIAIFEKANSNLTGHYNDDFIVIYQLWKEYQTTNQRTQANEEENTTLPKPSEVESELVSEKEADNAILFDLLNLPIDFNLTANEEALNVDLEVYANKPEEQVTSN